MLANLNIILGKAARKAIIDATQDREELEYHYKIIEALCLDAYNERAERANNTALNLLLTK